MKPRITVITLGVDDLDAALSSYRDGLGFPNIISGKWSGIRSGQNNRQPRHP